MDSAEAYTARVLADVLGDLKLSRAVIEWQLSRQIPSIQPYNDLAVVSDRLLDAIGELNGVVAALEDADGFGGA